MDRAILESDFVISSSISEPLIKTPTWQWQYWNDLPYLTCSLLENWQHGFFTQQFYPHTPEQIVAALDSNATVYRVKQVHGNRVLTPEKIDAEIPTKTLDLEENKLACADAILSDRTQQAIWVASADCTPALIGDVQTGRVAAIHAGWRGTAQRIIPVAIARFVEFGSVLENLRVAMGPAIAGEVYQVAEEVAAEVGASLQNERLGSSKAILEALQAMSDSPISEDPQRDRVRLDVRRVNYLQLINLGVRPEQIAIAPYCTFQQPEYFFSYRRTNEKKVQWSGIVSNGV
jgi:polyphenol oxidase